MTYQEFTSAPDNYQRWYLWQAVTTGGGVGLTDAQLRATAVPVSGPITDAQARATPLTVSGTTTLPSVSFSRPADTTAYASGDLVANSTTAGSVTPMTVTVARIAAGSGMIRRVRVRKTGTGVTNASFRVHFYRTSPTVTNGDNGVFLSNQSANYMAACDVSSMLAFSDGAAGNGSPNIGSEINFKLPSGTDIFALIEARGAYTPASGETFTLEVEVLQN